MIFDKLDNIELYKGLSDTIYEGLKFLKQANSSLAVGTYQICSGVRALVSEYETKTKNEYGFEAHKQYIDIQGLLLGEERVAYMPIEKLKETKAYNKEVDAAFYSTEEQSQEMIIGNSYFAILYPQDGHMPQLCVDAPMKVKKVVVKVRIDE